MELQAGAERDGGAIVLENRAPENVAHLLLHAAAVTVGPQTQPRLHILFEIADHELSHGRLLSRRHDIMTGCVGATNDNGEPSGSPFFVRTVAAGYSR